MPDTFSATSQRRLIVSGRHRADSPQNSSTSGDDDTELYDDHEEDKSFSTVEKDQAFWEEQEQLLKVSLKLLSSPISCKQF